MKAATAAAGPSPPPAQGWRPACRGRPEAARLLVCHASGVSRASQSGGDLTQQQVYDMLMKSTFAPALRKVGLKGSGGRFELPSPTHWVQLGFQKSAFSDSDSVTFTVNLSVISRETWAERAAAAPHLGARPAPSTSYGSWGTWCRIGELMPSGEDHWWWLRRGQEAAPVAEDVVTTLLDVAVPWLAGTSAA